MLADDWTVVTTDGSLGRALRAHVHAHARRRLGADRARRRRGGAVQARGAIRRSRPEHERLGAAGGEYSFVAVSSARPRFAARGRRSPVLGRRRERPQASSRPPLSRSIPVEVSTLEWAVTIGVTVAVLLFDVVVIARDPHEPSMKECAIALCVYVGAAVAFGAWVLLFHGHDYGIEFYAGWLTEYSLSIDNLFVFIILMAALKVPRHLQQEALMVGHHPGADLPRHLHRARLPADRELLLDLLHLRCVPGLHGVQPGAELPQPRGRAPRGQRGRQVRPEPPQRRRGVPRAQALVPSRTAAASCRRC